MILRLCTIAVVASLALTLTLMPLSGTTATLQAPGIPPTAVDVRIALAEIAVTPQAIAACGLSDSLTAILDRLEGAGEQMNQLRTLRQSITTASQALTSLGHAVSIRPGDEQASAQYHTAAANVQSLHTQLAEAQQGLLALATQDLSSAQIQKLNTFRQSQGRQVPPEFRVTSRTDAEWQAIELALIAERRAQQLGQPQNPQSASLLIDIRTDPDVIAATASVQAHLAEIETAIAAHTAQEG